MRGKRGVCRVIFVALVFVSMAMLTGCSAGKEKVNNPSTEPKPTKTVEIKDKIKFIEEKFGIDLPDSAEVINFYTDVFALEVITKDPPPHSGISVGAKIRLSDEDAEKLKTDLANSRYTEREYPSLTLKHEVDWWDLEDKDAKWCFERHCPIEYYSTEDDKENDIRTRYSGGQYISMKEIEGEYNYIYIMG